ncbi:MAG: bifunctional metallophosphatase/5'-nucleotidase [Clostridia bacterium]|nr:bifunctional metallophosphatase/5'-nucleotidase [Clostridia bacterium]
MKRYIGRKTALSGALALALLCALAPAPAEEAAWTDVAILSTTDMHGKCWETNILTGAEEPRNMLRVSTAVRAIREEYGAENVLLIDNGDLFQGTPVSQVQLTLIGDGRSSDPPAMALCLREIGYDAFVPGNHEFNYGWDTMSGVYRWMEDAGIPVVCANIVYDGSDEALERGGNAFTPYIVRTVRVGGREHRIGILGLENVDVPRWDVRERYPGLMFCHPDNETGSVAAEAERYIARMRAEGCEFIIAAYHGGLGEAEGELVRWVNTEMQGLRLIRETEGIDLLILGHDHTDAYSGSSFPNASGRPVPVVNGAAGDLTRSVFRFSEDAEGALVWELLESGNLKLNGYAADPALEAKMAPYAETAIAEAEKPIGTAAGDWDGSDSFYLRQTDTVDLVCAALAAVPSERMRAKYADPAAADTPGLDHLGVDIVMTGMTVSDGYTVRPGPLSVRDAFRLYRFNNTVFVFPVTGRQIRAVIEENAASRLTAEVTDGEVRIAKTGDDFTHILFGGLNFTVDMAAPAGERVRIDGFPDGRAFEEDGVYLAAVISYFVGNGQCGLRDFRAEDALWAQAEDGEDSFAQDLIAAYIRGRCEGGGVITPEDFTWHWTVVYGD